MSSITISADLSGLDSLIDQLGSDVDQAVRPAAQAGSQVLYDEVKKNVAQLTKSGRLASSIYRVYSTDNSGQSKATYHISWNAKKAPHGGLVEYGHLQRYRYYQASDGTVRPMVRPSMQGQPKPGRRASQAAKDAYYVPLPTPIQIPAKAYMRRAADHFPQAYEAAAAELLKRIGSTA
jgi:hypothetical protein